MEVVTLLQDNAVGALVGIVVTAAVAFGWKKVGDGFRDVRSAHHAREDAKARKVAQRALGSPHFYAFLSWYYGVSLYQHEGTSYPAVVTPILNSEKQDDPSSVLQAWPHQGPAFLKRENGDFVAFDQAFLSRRKRSGTVENRQTFCARALSDMNGGNPVIEGGFIGFYEDCLATTDSLEHELLSAFGKHLPEPRQFEEFKHRLPLRNAHTQFCKKRGLSPVFSGAGRSAALAISTLTVAYRESDKEFVTFLAPRSAKTAVHAHLLHVAPSGMFQPSKDWPQRPDERYGEEWDLRHHVLQELPEELFDIKVEQTEGETPRRFYKILEVEELDNMLDSKGAQLFVTGVLVNLLNLRPEICTLLIISDGSWYRQHDRAQANRKNFKRNWEFVQDEEVREAHRTDAKGRLFWRKPITKNGNPLSDSDLRRSIGDTSASAFVVPGAVALWLGMALFRQKLSQLESSR